MVVQRDWLVIGFFLNAHVCICFFFEAQFSPLQENLKMDGNCSSLRRTAVAWSLKESTVADNLEKQAALTRGIGLLEASSTNMLQMIGIGPFITLPILLSAMGGPQALLGWFLAGIVALGDGLVWAELGAALPGAGGPYHYLKEAYGPRSLGQMMSFIYIWETTMSAPLSLASGAVGLSLYVKFFWPSIGLAGQKLIAVFVCLTCMTLLYREIRSVGKLSVALWIVVMLTLGWVVVAGLMHFRMGLVLDFPQNAFQLSPHWFLGLGSATLIAMYSYGGYSNVCLFGGEVKNPTRTIPRSIIYAILVVGTLYIIMSVTIVGVVPWREAIGIPYIVSEFIRRIYGSAAATVMTLLILCASLASVFAAMLGYSRVPYAAAVDGRFFKVFANVHPTKHFPTFSLLFLGITSTLTCLLNLGMIISALMVIQIVTQFIPQVLAVTMIRRYRKDIARPFRMWLYPVPSLVALAGWMWMLIGSGWHYILLGSAILLFGIGAYLLQAKHNREWPFLQDQVTA
jgi:amino acid transporter